jgi:hypothetical protein
MCRVTVNIIDDDAYPNRCPPGDVVSPWRALHRFLIERLERRGVSVVKVRRRCSLKPAEARVESAPCFNACN